MLGLLTDNAFAAASTFTLLCVYIAGFLSIYSIVKKECAGGPITWQRIRKLFSPEYLFRTPLGFLLMTFGLALRSAASFPSRIFLENRQLDQFLLYSEKILPWIMAGTEAMIYIGAVVIFWPTILILMHFVFGPNRGDQFYVKAGLIFSVLFKVFLTIVGVILFYCLVGLIG